MSSARRAASQRAHRRLQRTDRKAAAEKLSAGCAAEAGEGRGNGDPTNFSADPGRCTPFSQEARRA